MKTGRRNFLKGLLGIAALRVVGIAKVLKSKPEPTINPNPLKLVRYGVAGVEYPKGLVMVSFRSWLGIDCWASTKCYNTVVMVNCPEPIKKGQTLLWYPDGTIRGSTNG